MQHAAARTAAVATRWILASAILLATVPNADAVLLTPVPVGNATSAGLVQPVASVAVDQRSIQADTKNAANVASARRRRWAALAVAAAKTPAEPRRLLKAVFAVASPASKVPAVVTAVAPVAFAQAAMPITAAAAPPPAQQLIPFLPAASVQAQPAMKTPQTQLLHVDGVVQIQSQQVTAVAANAASVGIAVINSSGVVAAAAAADSGHNALRGGQAGNAQDASVGAVNGAANATIVAATSNKAVVEKAKLTPRSWFAVTLSFAFVVKCLCMLSNVAFQMSPIPQVQSFDKRKCTGEADAAPFISIFYAGSQWCFYGVFAFLVTHKTGFLVLVYSNFSGVFLGLYYIWGFQKNCRNPAQMSMLFKYFKVVLTLVLCQFVAMLTQTRERALFFSGFVSSVCSVAGACSLLATLPVVMKTKSSASMNKPLLLIGLLSNCLWLLCGFMLWDAWIVVPNSCGIFVQFIACGVVLYYPDQPAGDAPEAGSGTTAREEGDHDDCGDIQDPGQLFKLDMLGETGGT